MSKLSNGHTTVDISTEPDGRIRLSVIVDGEEQAAPTFAAVDFFNAVDSLSDDETRAAATACISKALGYSDAIDNQWTARVLRLLDAADIAFTRTRPTGDGND